MIIHLTFSGAGRPPPDVVDALRGAAPNCTVVDASDGVAITGPTDEVWILGGILLRSGPPSGWRITMGEQGDASARAPIPRRMSPQQCVRFLECLRYTSAAIHEMVENLEDLLDGEVDLPADLERRLLAPIEDVLVPAFSVVDAR